MAVADMVVVGVRDATNGISVWGLQDDGTVAWNYDTGANPSGVVRDSLGNFYVVGADADNGDGNGTRNLWKLDSSGNYVDGTLIGILGDAYAIDIDATYIYIAAAGAAVRLEHDLSNSTNIVTHGSGSFRAIQVDSSGNIYIGGGGFTNTLYKYNSDLVSQWNEDTNDTTNSIDFLANGDVIVGTNDTEVRYYLADGSSPSAGTWAYVFGGLGAYIRVVVDSNDVIYAIRANDSNSSDERFVCLNTSGVRQWGITTPGGDLERIFITSDDSVYVCGDYQKAFNIFKVDTVNQILNGLMVTSSCGSLLGISATSDFSFSKELRNDIQGFWKLNDDAANTTVVDDSGNAYNGVASKNTSAMTVAGKINEALTFVKGDSDEVLLGDLALFDFAANEDKTISFWFKWDGVDTGFDYECMIHKYNDTGGQLQGLVVRFDKSSYPQAKIRADVYEAGSPIMSFDRGNDVALATGWHLAVVRWDRSGSGFISIDNWTYSGTAVISTQEATAIDNTEPVSFAGGANVSAAFVPYGGDLDCVAVWDRIITQEEELEVWNGGSGTEDFGIWEVPVITVQPISQTKNIGDSVTFSITATGNPTPTYQWNLDGSPIAGETSATLTFTVDANSGGDYTCVATNAAGSDTSDTATLSIIPLITAQSSDTGIFLKQQVTLTVTAVGFPVPTYQWYKGVVLITGETNSNYTFYTEESSAGTYTCVVTNGVGSDTTSGIVLTILTNPYVSSVFNVNLDQGRV